MSRISYFQRFSQRENHATNNTLLVFRYFYQSSPFKAQRVLASLLGEDLSIGLNFDQQIKRKQSIPDGQITQNSLRLFIETKLGGELDREQISRHIASIATKGPGAGDDFLIGLTKEPISRNDAKEIKEEAAKHGIKFAGVTFSQVKDALKDQCNIFERELLEIVEDYEEYLAEEKLLEESNRWLVVFPCGTSLSENVRFNLYYEPPSRPCKRNYRFIGIYNQKTVAYVGMVEAIIVASFEEGTVALTPEVGQVTDEHRARIKKVIEETHYYDLKSAPHRFYLVDSFIETYLKKSSAGGLWSYRYLDLSAIVPSFSSHKVYGTQELANLLKGREFQ